nr:topoisomerase [Trichoderma crystalligenum]
MGPDSSEDDMPLSRPNGRMSSSKISRAEDIALDKSVPKKGSGMAGLSIRNGPVENGGMDLDSPSTNGAKRKSRVSITKVDYKDESESDGEPLAKRQRSKKIQESDSDDEPMVKARGKKLPPSYKETALPESSDDEQPLGVKLAKKKASIEKAAEKEAKAIRAKEIKAKETKAKATPKKAVKNESDDDLPLASSSKRRQSNGSAVKRKSTGPKKEESDSDAPISKKAKPASASAKGKKATPAKNTKDAKKSKSKEVSEDDEEGFEWWNAPKREDDSIKWKTLEHNGVLFAPEYEPLPKNIKMYYDGQPVTLSPEAEEVATFWVAMMPTASTHHLDNPIFRKNFFTDFSEYIKKYGAKDAKGNKIDIKSLDKCDFSKMMEYWTAKNDAKKNMTKEEKAAAKVEKDALEAPYLHCVWDGRKQKVGNFRVEPPSLFRGRGEHPKTGKVKVRVLPEQITINIGKGAKVPEPPKGHKWKAVQHDQKATWLAMWQENINGAYKYVMLGAASDVKGQSDYKKFEKARELKKHIDKIRRDYTKDLKSEIMADRQRATAMYLIDKLALRAGNEKDTENEADTVGCCSLKYEHISLQLPDQVTFDFLGKDSIRYNETARVDPQVFKNLKLFKKPPKTDGDDLFDRLNTSQLNKHLNSYMPGLTAKVFRTYNASYTMAELLKELGKDPRSRGTIAEKVKLYNDCNRKVAILCNHKRTVGAGHEQQMQKLGDRIKGLRYQKWRTKKMILDIEPSQKKKKGAAFFQLDEDLDQEWIKEHQQFLIEELRTKITKKFEKDNEKLRAGKERALPEKELKERLQAVKELEAKFKKENKTGKVEAEGRGPTVEKLLAGIDKIDERIRILETQAEDRDGNKEVALSTSKINYIDPRLTVVFSKKFDVPIEKFFSKTLRDKFRWAIKSVEDAEDWEF